MATTRAQRQVTADRMEKLLVEMGDLAQRAAEWDREDPKPFENAEAAIRTAMDLASRTDPLSPEHEAAWEQACSQVAPWMSSEARFFGDLPRRERGLRGL